MWNAINQRLHTQRGCPPKIIELFQLSDDLSLVQLKDEPAWEGGKQVGDAHLITFDNNVVAVKNAQPENAEDAEIDPNK